MLRYVKDEVLQLCNAAFSKTLRKLESVSGQPWSHAAHKAHHHLLHFINTFNFARFCCDSLLPQGANFSATAHLASWPFVEGSHVAIAGAIPSHFPWRPFLFQRGRPCVAAENLCTSKWRSSRYCIGSRWKVLEACIVTILTLVSNNPKRDMHVHDKIYQDLKWHRTYGFAWWKKTPKSNGWYWIILDHHFHQQKTIINLVSRYPPFLDTS